MDSIIRKYEETGETAATNKKRGAFRGSKVSQEHVDAMLPFVTDHPSATLLEIQQHLKEQTGLHLSITTVQKCLHDRLHITLKRTNVEHDRHNSAETMAARQAWAQHLRAQGQLLDQAVFLDEAGFHLQQTRSASRAPVGSRATVRGRPYNRGPNLLLLIAVDRTGILASFVKTGAWNSSTLLDLLRPRLLAALEGQHRMLILDNVNFHHSNAVTESIQAAGHRLLLLPPYTPWFNIAERVFGYIKPIVNRQELRDADGIRNLSTSSSARSPPTCALAGSTSVTAGSGSPKLAKSLERSMMPWPLSSDMAFCRVLRSIHSFVDAHVLFALQLNILFNTMGLCLRWSITKVTMLPGEGYDMNSLTITITTLHALRCSVD